MYFSAGEREIGDEVVTAIEHTQEKMSMTCYPTIFTDRVSVVLDQQMISGSNVEPINAMAQKVYSFSLPASGEKSLLLNLGGIEAGHYFLRISNSQKRGPCRIVKR